MWSMRTPTDQQRLVDYLRWSDHHAAWTDLHIARHLGWRVPHARRIVRSLVIAGRVTQPTRDYVRLTYAQLRAEQGALAALPFPLVG